jgi:hypothetical protein
MLGNQVFVIFTVPMNGAPKAPRPAWLRAKMRDKRF